MGGEGSSTEFKKKILDEIEDKKKWAMYRIREVIDEHLNTFLRPLFRGSIDRYRINFKLSTELETQIGDDMPLLIRLTYRDKIMYMKAPYRELFKQVFDEHRDVFENMSEDTIIDIAPFLARFVENEFSSSSTMNVRQLARQYQDTFMRINRREM